MQYTVTPSRETHPPRRAAVNALAIVGFIALVFIGILLAIYAAKTVPTIVSRIGSAFGVASTGGNDGGLVVVPSEEPIDTTPPVVETPVATSTPVTPAKPATSKPSTPAPAKPATPSNQVIGYRPVITDYPTPGSVQIPASGSATLYGDPNLTTRITAVGYVNSSGNDFRSDTSIDEDDRLAVKFTVTNTGTDKTGSWKVRVTLPTEDDRTFDHTSKSQTSLNPGDKMDFLVYLDRGDTRRGDDQDIRVEADPSDDVDESNERDNEDTAEIDVD